MGWFDGILGGGDSGGGGGLLGGGGGISQLMPLLYAAQAAGQASQPSRMPVSNGSVLGGIAGGVGEGYMQGQKSQYLGSQNLLAGQEVQQKQLANALTRARLTDISSRHPEWFSGMLGGSQPGGDAATPLSGGAPGALPGGGAGAPSISPASLPAMQAGGAALPAGGTAASASGAMNLQDASDYLYLHPEAKDIINKQVLGATDSPQYKGQVAQEEAAATAPYKIGEALVSQAGRGVTVAPGDSVFTGFSRLPPELQNSLYRMMNPGPQRTAGGPLSAPSGAAAGGGAPALSAPAGGGGTPGTDATDFPVQPTRGQGGTQQTPLTLEGATMQKTVLPAQFEKAGQDYHSAQTLSGQLDMMDHSIEALNQTGWSATGPGANMKLGAIDKINSLYTSLGKEPPFNPATVANWTDFNKESVRAGFELAKTLGSREAAMIVQQAVGAVPNAENSYLGARLVSSSLRQASQRQQDYYEYLTNYAKGHGGSTFGADIAFNKANPVKSYTNTAIVNALPNGAADYLRAHPDTAGHFKSTFGVDPALILGK